VLVYDLNRAMMDAGRSKVAALSLNCGIGFVQGDAEHLALADRSVDAVMVGFGIRNLTHMRQGLQEIFRVLKPGGRLVCLEFSTPPAPWFRRLYDLYSFHLMPLVGRVLVGSWQAYAYLFESIRVFPLPAEFADLFREIGFTWVTYLPLTQGIAVAHLGKKP
jgi:demethylmenaquinone methyltransferase/2-methoxy-6-polyprenyl-1,4-benzoquinol methylase